MVILHDSTKTILNGILENKNPFLFQKLKKRFFYKKTNSPDGQGFLKKNRFFSTLKKPKKFLVKFDLELTLKTKYCEHSTLFRNTKERYKSRISFNSTSGFASSCPFL